MARPLWFVKLLKKYFPYRKKIAGFSQYQPIKKIMSAFLFNGDSMVYLPKDKIVIQRINRRSGKYHSAIRNCASFY